MVCSQFSCHWQQGEGDMSVSDAVLVKNVTCWYAVLVIERPE